VPVAVVVATAMDIADVPDPGAGIVAGSKLTVTPVGWPAADNEIAASNPVTIVLVIVDLPLDPRATESDAGEAERA